MANGFNSTNVPPISAFSGDPAFLDLYNRIIGNTGPNGFMWTGENTSSKLSGLGDQFSGMFKNLVGRDPTSDELNSMFGSVGGEISNSPAGWSGTGFTDIQNLLSPYLQNTFGQQIKDNQTTQQNNAVTAAQSRVHDLVNSMNKNTTDFLTSPTAQSQIQGNLNNSGMLDGGAFSKTMAGLLSNGALQNENAALSGVTIPAEQNILQTSSAPYQNFLGNVIPGMNSFGSMNSNINDFNLQSALGQKLFDESQPSGFQTALGESFAGLNAAGNFMGGAGKAGASAAATSYICMELIRRGLATEMDLDRLHYKVMPAVLLKGRAFWNYAMNGKALVEAANKAKVDWKAWKPYLLDRVLSAETSVEAANRYALALLGLCNAADAMHLFDIRSLDDSFLDSLIFLPRLLFYKPYVQTVWKVFKMKTRFILDLPVEA